MFAKCPFVYYFVQDQSKLCNLVETEETNKMKKNLKNQQQKWIQSKYECLSFQFDIREN